MLHSNDVDDYIKAQAAFAQPILQRLRLLIEQADPEIEESIKWRCPCYSQHGLVCAIAGFKKHVNFSFFKGQHINDHHQLFPPSDNEKLAALTFTSVDDMPEDALLIDYIKQAIALNQQAPKSSNTKKNVAQNKASLEIPDDLQHALADHPQAHAHFTAFSFSKQRDYIQWLISAKKATTRTQRLATIIEWVSEGKSRNWKYENC